MSLPIPSTNDDSGSIIAESAAMQAVLHQVTQVASTKATVLITGETGVGKDVIAEAIHENSPRKERPFKAVNCGAFYYDLLQSELFGHEKGAFTGAISQRRGMFEQADSGTLFLNEVAEMSPEVQVKFLRVLEKQEFTRLGGEKNIKVDVRIIAATNVDLATAIKQKKFRQDLYYRLNLFRIHIPPLRDRPKDIQPLVNMFISKLSAEHNKPITTITPEALNYLQNAEWRGNVRELINAIETAIILSMSETLELKDFSEIIEFESETSQPEETAIIPVILPAIPEPESIPIESIGIDEHGNQTLADTSEISEKIRGLIELIETYGATEDVSDAAENIRRYCNDNTEKIERTFYTLGALIVGWVKLSRLNSSLPFVRTVKNKEIQLLSRGGLKEPYQKVFIPILKHLKNNGNKHLKEIHDNFNTTVVNQLKALSKDYLEIYEAKKSIDNEDANKIPTHRRL